MTNARLMQYEKILMEQPDLVILVDRGINLVSLIFLRVSKKQINNQECLNMISNKGKEKFIKCPSGEKRHLFIKGYSWII